MTANTPRSRKAKGRILQNRISEDILGVFPSLSSNDVKPAIMGESGIDIKLSAAARIVFPFGIETKNQENLSIWSCLEQCKINAHNEKLIPLLIFKRNRSDIYVAIRWDDFLKIISR
jgi:hypothetical protein